MLPYVIRHPFALIATFKNFSFSLLQAIAIDRATIYSSRRAGYSMGLIPIPDEPERLPTKAPR